MERARDQDLYRLFGALEIASIPRSGESPTEVPVMGWGIAISGKSYKLLDWLIALAVTGGCTIFLVHAGGTASQRFWTYLAFLFTKNGKIQTKLFTNRPISLSCERHTVPFEMFSLIEQRTEPSKLVRGCGVAETWRSLRRRHFAVR